MGDRFDEVTFQSPTATSVSETKLVLLVTNVMVSGGIMEFPLTGRSSFHVGRAPNSEVHIEAPSVSRKHAQFSEMAGKLTLKDLGSTNGTRINGEHIGAAPVFVKAGDAIRFGDVVAELRAARLSRASTPGLIKPEEFELRVDGESERCVRNSRSVGVIALEAEDINDAQAARITQLVTLTLRSLDTATRRVPGRYDVLIADCEKKDCIRIAERLHGELVAQNIRARVGVATYPNDVPSPESLALGAQLAMRATEPGKVGLAGTGARIVKIGGREIVVADPEMARLYALIERVAAAPLPALIQGETGSGKEIVAEAIHSMGPRAQRPLIKLNCAAVPETLLESELFGYEKGAFSDAKTNKPGLFEEAEGGTLFLDEIGEMSAPLQAKLLRVVEDRRVRRVGATVEKQINVRIVAATHQDLKVAVDEGRFREDLFYRLGAVVLRVPPLRERTREIILLAERFATEACDGAGRLPAVITPEVGQLLVAYHWPGNIRELRNVIHAAVMMCDGEAIEPRHLPPLTPNVYDTVEATTLPAPEPAADLAETATKPKRARRLTLEDELRNLERARIVEALEESGGNQTKASELLGMPRRTLVSKLNSLGIEGPRKRKRRDTSGS
jgi:DNA-binding NtrC family response regulator